jgi:hypothetical protein
MVGYLRHSRFPCRRTTGGGARAKAVDPQGPSLRSSCSWVESVAESYRPDPRLLAQLLDAEQRCRGRKHRAISDSVGVEASANRLCGGRRTANPHKHANDRIPRMLAVDGRGKSWVNLAPIHIRYRQQSEE